VKSRSEKRAPADRDVDGTDASISGGVVANDMCSSWRKRADPTAARSDGDWVALVGGIPVLHLSG
jgi:hypothetical protein